MKQWWLALLATTGLLATEPVKVGGRAMGTTWSATYVPRDAEQDSAELRQRLATRLEELEQIFSTYRLDSELSRFNARAETAWIDVSPELATVAAQSRAISELTGGAFDATVAPLLRLWGFGPNSTAAAPTDADIGDARAFVGFARLESREAPPALRKADARLTADFSSMAKGFAVDRLSEVLASLGARDHLVQIAGDLKASGAAPGADGWRLGVEDPTREAGAIAAVVQLTQAGALSTSGNHRNAITRGGRTFGHIIDPRTGRPVVSDVVSVSVVHDSCATSSALATGLFVLGLEDGMRLATAQRLAVMFLVRERGDVVRRVTPEWARFAK